MEDPWSNTFEHLSDACRALRLDQNYTPPSYQDSTDDDDDDRDDDHDDPLGRPEITVQINDDWTTSTDNNLHAVTNEDQSYNDEDEAELITRDRIVTDSFLVGISSSLQENFSYDEEDQLVPPSPKICKIMLDEEFALSRIEPVVEDTERSDYEDEEEEKEEGERKEEEKKDVFDTETGNTSKVEEATEDRSNPQPP